MPISDIALYRLFNQQILQPTLKTPRDVVAWLGALQGQDYAGAKWSVGLRLPGSTDADIEQAFADRTILRTWLMRGTLHLVAAEDIHWILGLVAPKLIAGNTRRYGELELDADTLTRSNDIIVEALQDGGLLNRKELLALLEEKGIPTEGQRGVYMLQRASLDGLICQGAAPRNVPTFMALGAAPPHVAAMIREEALAELARRYFNSRGPATMQDFAAWSGLVMADVRAGMEAVKAEFVEETIDDQTYWRPDTTPPTREIPPYLLPGFDEYLLGYRDRSAVLDPQYAQQVCPGGNGVFQPTIVIEGRMVGTWKRAFKKGAAQLTPLPFTTLTEAELEAFAAAAQPFGQFLEMPVTPA